MHWAASAALLVAAEMKNLSFVTFSNELTLFTNVTFLCHFIHWYVLISTANVCLNSNGLYHSFFLPKKNFKDSAHPYLLNLNIC